MRIDGNLDPRLAGARCACTEGASPNATSSTSPTTGPSPAGAPATDVAAGGTTAQVLATLLEELRSTAEVREDAVARARARLPELLTRSAAEETAAALRSEAIG